MDKKMFKGEMVEVFAMDHIEKIQMQIELFSGKETIKELMVQSWENIVARLMKSNSSGVGVNFLKSEVLKMIQSAIESNETGGEFRQSKQTSLEELQKIVEAVTGEDVPVVNSQA